MILKLEILVRLFGPKSRALIFYTHIRNSTGALTHTQNEITKRLQCGAALATSELQPTRFQIIKHKIFEIVSQCSQTALIANTKYSEIMIFFAMHIYIYVYLSKYGSKSVHTLFSLPHYFHPSFIDQNTKDIQIKTNFQLI